MHTVESDRIPDIWNCVPKNRSCEISGSSRDHYAELRIIHVRTDRNAQSDMTKEAYINSSQNNIQNRYIRVEQ